MSRIHVVVRRNGTFDRLIELKDGETVMGCSETCGIQLPHPHISSEHAILKKTSGQLWLRDNDSRNGTVLNGKILQTCSLLHEGSEIELGPYQLTIHFKAGPENYKLSPIGARTDYLARRESLNPGWSCDRKLTDAQRRVYHLLVKGLQEKEVAAALKLSVNTVHWHAKAIYRIMNVSTRGELIAQWAARQLQASQNREMQ